MNLGIAGKVALVCGASRGLGRALADELAAEGASLGLCARDAGTLEPVAREIAAAGGARVVALAGDLSVAGEPRRVVEACLAELGRLDILVVNTGGPPSGPADSFGPADWEQATALLLTSAVGLASSAVPGMRAQGWGRILFVTSIAAKQPVESLVLSNSLRAAVTGYAHTLAREVAADGITVNTILPGWTATERVVELFDAGALREGISPEEMRARVEAEIPIGRMAEPREFAALGAFLVSERASYITGQALVVDGGWIRGLF